MTSNDSEKIPKELVVRAIQGRAKKLIIEKNKGIPDIFWLNSVNIKCDIEINGLAVIFGDLKVDGDLRITELICFGNVVVNGNLYADNLYIGGKFRIKGNMSTKTLDVLNAEFKKYFESFQFDFHAGMILDPWFYKMSEYVGEPELKHEVVDSKLLYKYINVCEKYITRLHSRREYETNSVVDGNLVINAPPCHTSQVYDNLKVKGLFNPDDIFIGGGLSIGSGGIEGDLTVCASLECDGDLEVQGSLCAAQIACGGDLLVFNECRGHEIKVAGSLEVYDVYVVENLIVGGDITAQKDVDAGEYIKVGGAITTSNGIVKSGADYGVFGGLSFPRSEWAEKGFIESLSPPENLLSGVYRLHIPEVLPDWMTQPIAR